MRKVQYTPLAASDVAEAVTYITVNLSAPEAARDLLKAIDKAISQVQAFPYAQSLYRTEKPMKDELRWITVKNYVLYYCVLEDRIEVRRFLYGRRDRTNLAE